jgi:hypothetical protein
MAVLLLAAVHVVLSLALCFGGRLSAVLAPQPRRSEFAAEALALLHPWLYGGGLRPYDLVHPGVLLVAAADALVWSAVAVAVVLVLRRLFSPRFAVAAPSIDGTGPGGG